MLNYVNENHYDQLLNTFVTVFIEYINK